MKSYKFKFFKSVKNCANMGYSAVVYKSLVHNTYLSDFSRFISHSVFLNKISGRAFFSRMKIVCIATGRSRGNLNRFSISRLVFKEHCISGFMFGFRRSQWL